MIGLVLVSHSARLAEGVLELVDQMVQGAVPLALAGGTDIPDAPIGTDPVKVAHAVESLLAQARVSSVLVLVSRLISHCSSLSDVARIGNAHGAGALIGVGANSTVSGFSSTTLVMPVSRSRLINCFAWRLGSNHSV